MSAANTLRGYSLKKTPVDLQKAKDYEGNERTIKDDEGNDYDWWSTHTHSVCSIL